jgi:hypothetical protein
MPASAVQTKTWFWPNGWFTDRELAIVVNRVLRDDPSKGELFSTLMYCILECRRSLRGHAQPASHHSSPAMGSCQGH